MSKKTFTVHDLPREDRPRERLRQFGTEALSSQELLAIILGRGMQGESVMVISQKLLSHFGSLVNLQNASFEDLIAIKGIGEAKACQLLACFAVSKRITSSYKSSVKHKRKLRDFALVLRDKIGHASKEHFAVASLDARMNLIGVDVIAIGTLNANLVHPRETFEAAIRRHAACIITSHNHPSGHVSPSEDDVRVTRQLVAAGKLFGIPLIDHIIVTRYSFYSIQSDKEIKL